MWHGYMKESREDMKHQKAPLYPKIPLPFWIDPVLVVGLFLDGGESPTTFQRWPPEGPFGELISSDSHIKS